MSVDENNFNQTCQESFLEYYLQKSNLKNNLACQQIWRPLEVADRGNKSFINILWNWWSEFKKKELEEMIIGRPSTKKLN